MQKMVWWNVKRSGATMTIDGYSDAGSPMKITGITEIRRVSTDAGPRTIADRDDGSMLELL